MRYFIFLLVLLYSDISLSKNCNHAKSRKEAILLAKNQFAYEFNRVYYLKNYDGDTVTVEIEGVHPLIGHEIKIRVKGIDTPEIRARKSCEREIAKSAKEFTTKFLTSGGKITYKIAAEVHFSGLFARSG